MLFENPTAAKLPFPYNIPPPIQAAAVGVPQISATSLETANALIEHDLQNALIAINPLNGTPTAFAAVNGSPPSSATHVVATVTSAASAVAQCVNGTTTSHSGSSGRSTPTATSSGTDPAPGKLFVGGLSWQTSSDKLKEYFGMFGTVTDVLIMKDPVTQRSRGFGFITFSDPSSVEKVLKVPIHTLDGKKIDPKHATPKNRPKQSSKTKKIFVGGVSQDTSADEVKAYFGQFGRVEETVMLMDQQTKRHRGFGFVTFENEDVVDRVCEIHFHTIKNKKVECKKAQPKEAVTPAAQLLQKRLMLGGLGVRIPTATQGMVGPGGAQGMANPLAVAQAQAQAAQAHVAAAALQAQSAAAAGAYGKVFTTYPPSAALHSFRYAPYPIPASAAAAHAASAQQPPQGQPPGQGGHQQAGAAAAAAASAHQQHQHAAAHAAMAAQHQGLAGNPYQGYSLANVDMSSFQNVDWGSMYGLYV